MVDGGVVLDIFVVRGGNSMIQQYIICGHTTTVVLNCRLCTSFSRAITAQLYGRSDEKAMASEHNTTLHRFCVHPAKRQSNQIQTGASMILRYYDTHMLLCYSVVYVRLAEPSPFVSFHV